MLIPGSINADGEWIEPASMARTMEQELVLRGLVDLDEETEEAALLRRKGLSAMAAGMIKHLISNLDLDLDAGDLRSSGSPEGAMPAAEKTFTVTGSNQVVIGTGALRAASDVQTRIPPGPRTLTGKVR